MAQDVAPYLDFVRAYVSIYLLYCILLQTQLPTDTMKYIKSKDGSPIHGG